MVIAQVPRLLVTLVAGNLDASGALGMGGNFNGQSTSGFDVYPEYRGIMLHNPNNVAFGNPGAESSYNFLKENGLLTNRKFSDIVTNIICCQIWVVFCLFSEKFPFLSFTIHAYVNKRYRFGSQIDLQYKIGHRISPALISFNTCA